MLAVSQLMPTHIKEGGSRRRSDVSLATQALRMIGATVTGDMVVKLPDKKIVVKYDHQKRLDTIVAEDGIVDLRMANEADKKERHAFHHWLARRADRVGPGKYKLR